MYSRMNSSKTAVTSGDPPGEDAMAPVLLLLAHPLEGDINTELVDNYLADRRLDGDIDWDFLEVVEVDLDRVVRGEEAPLVRLRYCLDFTGWVTVDKDTGEHLSGPGTRRSAIVEAEFFDRLSSFRPGPQWHVYEWGDGEDGDSC